MEPEVLKQRHSLAHILAQAVQRSIDPYAKLGIGPAIDDGFYYDFIFSDGVTFGQDDLKPLTKYMQKILKENQPFVLYESSFDEAPEILRMLDQEFKLDLLEKFKSEGDTQVTFYLNTMPAAAAEKIFQNEAKGRLAKYTEITTYFRGKIDGLSDQFITFIDLCEGPHVDSVKEEIDLTAFKLIKTAGAYRRGDENNPMMTRIYGRAFPTKQALKEYETMMEEAKKRDHRVLGQKLQLFTISPLIGAGLPLVQPNGMIIRQEVEKYLRALHKDKGYQRVRTPHLAKEDLYKTSGHYDKFGDELFRVQGKDDRFFMKPMNCPHHMQIYASNQYSYRDMPIRYFEPGTVYRDEKTGQLSGLTRVRCITQDDGHLFCRINQIKQEVSTIVHIIKSFYETMGMIDEYRVSLSVRGDDSKMYLGDTAVWEKAENALQAAADAEQLPYKRIEGEAAFYGPKLDFMFKDAIGREWQLATIQCDFNLPERFDLTYINEDGDKERPVVIHRAISGSLERFMGVMIEHFAGAFPVRLAPTQVQIVTVADKFVSYAQQLQQDMQAADLRVKLDDAAESLNKKIRNAEMMKVPYILVIGEKEENEKSVSVREYKTKKQYEMPADEFTQKVMKEYQERSL